LLASRLVPAVYPDLSRDKANPPHRPHAGEASSGPWLQRRSTRMPKGRIGIPLRLPPRDLGSPDARALMESAARGKRDDAPEPVHHLVHLTERSRRVSPGLNGARPGSRERALCLCLGRVLLANRAPAFTLAHMGIDTDAELHWNRNTAPLVEHAIRPGEGVMAKE